MNLSVQINKLNTIGNLSRHLVFSNALDTGQELKMLCYSEELEQDVVLWADAWYEVK